MVSVLDSGSSVVRVRVLAGEIVLCSWERHFTLTVPLSTQGPVARILVNANRWLRGIKTYRFPWYLTPVSGNHASNNPGQVYKWVLAKMLGVTLR